MKITTLCNHSKQKSISEGQHMSHLDMPIDLQKQNTTLGSTLVKLEIESGSTETDKDQKPRRLWL